MIKVFGPYKGIAIGKNENGKYQAVLRLAIVDENGAYKPLSDNELKQGFDITSDKKATINISAERIISKKGGSKSKLWKATITADKPGLYTLSIARQGEQTVQYILHFPPSSSTFQAKVLDIFIKMISKLYDTPLKKIRNQLVEEFKITELYQPLKNTNSSLIKAIKKLGLYNASIEFLRKKYPKAWKASVEKLAFYLTKERK